MDQNEFITFYSSHCKNMYKVFYALKFAF